MAMMYGGMLYFPLKVNLFEEIAVELVEARFGLKGTAAVMKLLCKIHKENGYYLKWNAEQCTLFTNKAGKDINEQEMQGIVDILVEKVFFDPKTYREQGVLTSTEIQKVWLEATKRRKRDLTTLPYLLVETEEDKPDKDKGRQRGLKLSRLDVPFLAKEDVQTSRPPSMQQPGHLAKASSRVPDVKGKTVRNAVELFARAGIVPELKGTGTRVVRQSPPPGTAWPKEGENVTYILWLSER